MIQSPQPLKQLNDRLYKSNKNFDLNLLASYYIHHSQNNTQTLGSYTYYYIYYSLEYFLIRLRMEFTILCNGELFFSLFLITNEKKGQLCNSELLFCLITNKKRDKWNETSTRNNRNIDTDVSVQILTQIKIIIETVVYLATHNACVMW